jgi:hypothetical protein
MPSFKLVISVAVLAIVAAFGSSFLVSYFRPVPSFAAGISTGVKTDKEAAAQLTKKLLQGFPLGSPEAALTAELERQGWSAVHTDNINKSDRPWRYVDFKRPVNLLFVELSTVMWQSDENGRLIAIEGGYFRDAAFKQGGWS